MRQGEFGIWLATLAKMEDKMPPFMKWKRRVGGGIVAFIGYMLSPLSWWNDLFVNVPLALAFAWLIALFCKPAFKASFVLGYWLTNLFGFILLHKGTQTLLTEKTRKYSRRDLTRDLIVSLLYTALIVVLIKIGILKPVQDYFSR